MGKVDKDVQKNKIVKQNFMTEKLQSILPDASIFGIRYPSPGLRPQRYSLRNFLSLVCRNLENTR